MLLSMVVMTFTGVILFIAPPGRIANWSNWHIFGLDKHQYANIHSTFMVLFVVMTILHLYYNWKPITSYMRNSLKQMIVLTKDMIVAVILVLIFLFGSMFQFTPFSDFIDFGEGLKKLLGERLWYSSIFTCRTFIFTKFCKEARFPSFKM